MPPPDKVMCGAATDVGLPAAALAATRRPTTGNGKEGEQPVLYRGRLYAHVTHPQHASRSLAGRVARVAFH